MAYEIIETTDHVDVSDSTPISQFTVIDPHPTFPIVYSIHDNRADAEEALAEIKRGEAIAEAFDSWVFATADEFGVSRSTVADLLDVSQYR